MKKILLRWAVLLPLIAFVACKKNNSSNDIPPLEVSKTSGIKLGEPVAFSVRNTNQHDSVRWTVTPSTNVQIRPGLSSASIIFLQSGNYNVTGTLGNNVSGSSVVVSNETFSNPSTSEIQSLNEDQISITPSIYAVNNDFRDSSFLILKATTGKKYNCLNNYLMATPQTNYTNNQNVITISYNGVSNIGQACEPGQVQAIANTWIYPFKDGDNILKIVLNGRTYTGSIHQSGNTYTFTWPNNDGVTIYPLTVSK